MAISARHSVKVILPVSILQSLFYQDISIGRFEEHHVARHSIIADMVVSTRPLTPKYYFSGYVYEINTSNPISRVVRLYRRSNGELIDSTTSSSKNGYYYVETPYDGDHYIVALDDELGVQYNLVALDWMVPISM